MEKAAKNVAEVVLPIRVTGFRDSDAFDARPIKIPPIKTGDSEGEHKTVEVKHTTITNSNVFMKHPVKTRVYSKSSPDITS